MAAVIWIGLTVLLIVAPIAVPRWRLRRALARPLSVAAIALLERNVAQYAGMPAPLQQQLQRLVVQFLYQKKFIGCAGLEVDDEVRVTIAGQACLLLLNRPSRVYPALDTVLVYPGAFLVERSEVGADGVVLHEFDDMLGESWGDGRVILAWDHVRRGSGCDDGQNVVLHEFAHQLDSESGAANGAPYLGSPARYRSWAAVLSRDFAHLRHDARRHRHGVLDHYGASDPAEFFAVATEAFFERPHQLADCHPALYHEFQKYYRVDPRTWLARPDQELPEAADQHA